MQEAITPEPAKKFDKITGKEVIMSPRTQGEPWRKGHVLRKLEENEFLDSQGKTSRAVNFKMIRGEVFEWVPEDQVEIEVE